MDDYGQAPPVRGRLVGVAGFEPTAPRSQSECATKLRHTPGADSPSVYVQGCNPLAETYVRGRCRGNSITCWKVGRFCQSMVG
ncbi:MAG: hypothetical protein JWQ74_3062 [Marmoricola sp.]|nr:hypothetical protein [Marmoricola sp.]